MRPSRSLTILLAALLTLLPVLVQASSFNTSVGGAAGNTSVYVLGSADASLPNALNLGALTTGVLYQTVSAGAATPATIACATAGTLLQGGSPPTCTATPTVTTSLTGPIVYGGTAANSTLTLQGTSNGTPSNAYVLLNPAGGNVGIGTTTPHQPFEVVGLIISNTGPSAGGIRFGDSGGSSVLSSTLSPNTLTLNGVGFATVAIPLGNVAIGNASATTRLTITDANQAATQGQGQVNIQTSTAVGADIGATLGLGGASGQASTPWNWATIAGRSENNVYAGYFQVVVSSAGGGDTERLRITSTGNVGIGTSTFGTSAATVVALANGTAPSTPPASQIQLWAANIAGANTSGLNLLDEPGNTYKLGNGCWTTLGLNGQLRNECFVTELTTVASGVLTQQTTITIPADAVVLAVPVRVTVQPGNTTTMTVTATVTGTVFQKGASISSAANTTDPGTRNVPLSYSAAAAQTILLTFNATTNNALGRVRVSIYYYTITPPTSMAMPEWLRELPANDVEERTWFARWQPAA